MLKPPRHLAMLSCIAFLLLLGVAYLHPFFCLCLCYSCPVFAEFSFRFLHIHMVGLQVSYWLLLTSVRLQRRDPVCQKKANRWAIGKYPELMLPSLKFFEHISVECWGTYQVCILWAVHSTGLQWLNRDECFNVDWMRQYAWHRTLLVRYTRPRFHVDVF